MQFIIVTIASLLSVKVTRYLSTAPARGIMTNLTGFERKKDTTPTVFLLNYLT